MLNAPSARLHRKRLWKDISITLPNSIVGWKQKFSNIIHQGQAWGPWVSTRPAGQDGGWHHAAGGHWGWSKPWPGSWIPSPPTWQHQHILVPGTGHQPWVAQQGALLRQLWLPWHCQIRPYSSLFFFFLVQTVDHTILVRAKLYNITVQNILQALQAKITQLPKLFIRVPSNKKKQPRQPPRSLKPLLLSAFSNENAITTTRPLRRDDIGCHIFEWYERS